MLYIPHSLIGRMNSNVRLVVSYGNTEFTGGHSKVKALLLLHSCMCYGPQISDFVNVVLGYLLCTMTSLHSVPLSIHYLWSHICVCNTDVPNITFSWPPAVGNCEFLKNT
jgi:hypothetical protein